MITIGITDCSRWKNYHDWFASKDVHVIKLSEKENNLSDIEKCDGVVLSGGEDVHPKYYGKPSYMKKKKELKLEVNEPRDKFELKVIDKTVKSKKPLLGICRGLQIANVYFKGTLIPHLTPPLSKGERVKHSRNQGYDQKHEVDIKSDSCLSAIIKNTPITGSPPEGRSWRGAVVNSAHHQAADKIGKGLKVSARSKDGVVEAIEWKNPKDKPFLLLVQWHPERMREQKSGLAKNLKKKFLQEIRKR